MIIALYENDPFSPFIKASALRYNWSDRALCNFGGWHHVQFLHHRLACSPGFLDSFIRLHQLPAYGNLLVLTTVPRARTWKFFHHSPETYDHQELAPMPHQCNWTIFILFFDKRTDQGISLVGASEPQQGICPSQQSIRASAWRGTDWRAETHWRVNKYVHKV